MTTLPRSAGALALAAFLAAGPAWAADPSPIPARGADEIGPRVIDLGGPTPRTRPAAGDTMTRFYVLNPSAVAGDQVAYGGGGYPGLWTGDGTFSRRNPHRFMNRNPAIDTARPGPIVAFRGPRQVFQGGGIASPGISNFPSRAAIRSGGFVGSRR